MKKVIALALLFAISLLICGCDTMNMKLEYVDQDFIIMDSLNETKTYSYTEITKDLESGLTDKFIKKYGVEKYKSVTEGSNYTIIKSSEGVVLITFDADRKNAGSELISFSSETIEGALDNVKIGDQLSTVMEIDPLGNYDFMYASWSNYPRISYHYVGDFGYSIVYDNTTVIEISKITL